MTKNIIYVSSYPKSGATWLQFLIFCCYNGPFKSSKEVLRFYPPSNRNKLIEKNSHNPLFIKSHAAHSRQISLLDDNARCILLVRHPLDIGHSLINHHKNQGSLRLLLPYFQNKFLMTFLNENKSNENTSWNYHSASWLKQKQFPLHIIRYDDLITQPIPILAHLRNVYELEFTDKDIANAVDLCSIEKMKALEKKELDQKIAGLFYSRRRKLTKRLLKSSFVNKGGTLDHQTKFTESYLNNAADIFNPMLKELDFKLISKTGNK